MLSADILKDVLSLVDNKQRHVIQQTTRMISNLIKHGDISLFFFLLMIIIEKMVQQVFDILGLNRLAYFLLTGDQVTRKNVAKIVADLAVNEKISQLLVSKDGWDIVLSCSHCNDLDVQRQDRQRRDVQSVFLTPPPPFLDVHHEQLPTLQRMVKNSFRSLLRRSIDPQCPLN